MELAAFHPTSCQHTPPTLGKWPLAWLGRGGPWARMLAVGTPKSSAH